MPTCDILQLISKPALNPQPVHSGLQTRPGYVPNFRERNASKKVDDISRHESKHDMVPKHDPKPNAREKSRDAPKSGGFQPERGKAVPGTVKK
jgi:hypothetical protein